MTMLPSILIFNTGLGVHCRDLFNYLLSLYGEGGHQVNYNNGDNKHHEEDEFEDGAFGQGEEQIKCKMQ